MKCNPQPKFVGGQNRNERDDLGMQRVWGQERCVQGFGRKPEGKEPLGIPRRRWDDNNKMYRHEVEYGVMDWIQLSPGQGQVANTCVCVINIRVP